MFQESVSGDFGCNWGEATKDLFDDAYETVESLGMQ